MDGLSGNGQYPQFFLVWGYKGPLEPAMCSKLMGYQLSSSHLGFSCFQSHHHGVGGD